MAWAYGLGGFSLAADRRHVALKADEFLRKMKGPQPKLEAFVFAHVAR
ncbi:MAG: hypothetical protein ABSF28_19945 [Terracidiphilus sp.]|jgi:hypothetical protein